MGMLHCTARFLVSFGMLALQWAWQDKQFPAKKVSYLENYALAVGSECMGDLAAVKMD